MNRGFCFDGSLRYKDSLFFLTSKIKALLLKFLLLDNLLIDQFLSSEVGGRRVYVFFIIKIDCPFLIGWNKILLPISLLKLQRKWRTSIFPFCLLSSFKVHKEKQIIIADLSPTKIASEVWKALWQLLQFGWKH